MPGGTLDGLRVLAFEARRAEELATMLARHGATVTRAPALREAGLPASPEADELVLELRTGHIWTVILLTGVGTRALAAAVAAACPEFPQLLARTTLQYDPHPFLMEGMDVEVVRGPLTGVRGKLLRKDRVSRLVLAVTLIHQAAVVEIHPADIVHVGSA